MAMTGMALVYFANIAAAAQRHCAARNSGTSTACAEFTRHHAPIPHMRKLR